MKSIRTFLLALGALLLAVAPLSAADPVVVVQSATSVTVDGQDYGQPIDAMKNNPALAPAIQRALAAWAEGKERERAAEKAAVVSAAAEQEKALKAEHAKEMADAKNARALLDSLRQYADKLPPPVAAALAALDASDEDRELADLEAKKAAIAERQKRRAKEKK